jgi:hypothetical protein
MINPQRALCSSPVTPTRKFTPKRFTASRSRDSRSERTPASSCSDRSQGAKWSHVSAKDAPMRGGARPHAVGRCNFDRFAGFAIAGRGHRTVTRNMHPVVALPTRARMIQATWRMQFFPTASTCEAGSAEPELQDRCKRHRLLVRDCDSEKLDLIGQELGALHRGLQKLAAAGTALVFEPQARRRGLFARTLHLLSARSSGIALI